MGPLHGLRVIELAAIGPGPMACMLLGDLGADVVRIDRLQPSGLGLALDGRFDVNARGRRSLALDLQARAGQDAALCLVQTADVLVEGFRPGVAEGPGLGPDACVSAKPRLVYDLSAGGGWSVQRGTNLLDGGAPFYDTDETACGRYISLAALEPKFFAVLAQALGWKNILCSASTTALCGPTCARPSLRR